jgi:hypothetical protein
MFIDVESNSDVGWIEINRMVNIWSSLSKKDKAVLC